MSLIKFSLFIICLILIILLFNVAYRLKNKKINDEKAKNLSIILMVSLLIAGAFLFDSKDIKNDVKEVQKDLKSLSSYTVNQAIEAKTFVDAQRCERFTIYDQKINCYKLTLIESERIQTEFKNNVLQLVNAHIEKLKNGD